MDKIPLDFRANSKGDRERKNAAISDASLAEAEQVAAIVSKGLENGNYWEIAQELETYSEKMPSREQTAFEPPSKIPQVIVMIVAAFFSIEFLYVIRVLAGTAFYSDEYETLAVAGCFCSAAMILFNVILVLIAWNKMRFYKRYRGYYDMLRLKTIVIIDDLVDYSKQKSVLVTKDLYRAVRLKLIPQGHFGKEDMYIMLSNEIYHIYEQKPAAFDRFFRKLIDERNRISERTPQMESIMRQGKQYIEKIKESNEIIKDKEISNKLYRMEKLVSMIFHEVDINPNQADNLGLFLSYYLPTTDKLLEAYIDLDEKPIKGKNLAKAKRDISKAIDTLNKSFDGILDQFYQEQEIDISSEISAMEIMMKQEGLLEDS